MEEYEVKIGKFLSGLTVLVKQSKKSDYVLNRFGSKSLCKELGIKYEYQVSDNPQLPEYIEKANLFFKEYSKLKEINKNNIDNLMKENLNLTIDELEDDMIDMLDISWRNTDKTILSWEMAGLAIEVFDWENKFPENIKRVIQKGMFATFSGFSRKIPNRKYSLFIKAFVKYLIPYAYSSSYTTENKEALISLKECQAFWDELRIILDINSKYPCVIIGDERDFVEKIKNNQNPYRIDNPEKIKGNRLTDYTSEQIAQNEKETKELLEQMEDVFIKDEKIDKTARVLVKNWLK